MSDPGSDEHHQAEAEALRAGWDWLSEHGPEHPKHEAFFDRWLDRLQAYQRLYDMDRGEEEKRSTNGPGLIERVRAGRYEQTPFAGLESRSVRRERF